MGDPASLGATVPCAQQVQKWTYFHELELHTNSTTEPQESRKEGPSQCPSETLDFAASEAKENGNYFVVVLCPTTVGYQYFVVCVEFSNS